MCCMSACAVEGTVLPCSTGICCWASTTASNPGCREQLVKPATTGAVVRRFFYVRRWSGDAVVNQVQLTGQMQRRPMIKFHSCRR